MCPLLTSIDSACDLLWALLSKGLAALRADWMFNLLASKLRSEHTPHNGTHSSRWPLLSPRQLSGRQTDKEILCMCVCRGFLEEKDIEKKQKCLSEPVSGHIGPPVLPSLSLSFFHSSTSFSQISGFSFLTPKESNTSIKLCAFMGALFHSYFCL